MAKVVVVQRVLTNYRIPFFEGLRANLQEKGIELGLLYGRGNAVDRQRGYLADLSWGQVIPEQYLKFGKYEVVLQPYLKELLSADLVIVAQEMKLWLNHILLLSRPWAHFKLGFWGHVMNYQEPAHSWPNRIKRYFNNTADWWFAYTGREAEFIAAHGFPVERISIVQNSIDTRELVEGKQKISAPQWLAFRRKLGIGPQDRVGLFCGGLYKEKRLDFLLEACQQIKQRLPDFHMIIIGGGPLEEQVQRAAAAYPWIHFAGPVYEEPQKILYFMIADLLLSPGLVGLAILDSLAMDLPIITTQYAHHSPEIEYLENGKNGIITDNTLEDFYFGVLDVLTIPGRLPILKEGCRNTVAKYSTEQMVKNFAEGIEQCLQTYDTSIKKERL